MALKRHGQTNGRGAAAGMKVRTAEAQGESGGVNPGAAVQRPLEHPMRIDDPARRLDDVGLGEAAHHIVGAEIVREQFRRIDWTGTAAFPTI